jgi:hypothetical protein
VLSNHLLSGVCNRYQSLQSILYSSAFCLINTEQSYIFSVSMYSGVAFQPAHCTVSLNNLTAASTSSSILREILS